MSMTRPALEFDELKSPFIPRSWTQTQTSPARDTDPALSEEETEEATEEEMVAAAKRRKKLSSSEKEEKKEDVPTGSSTLFGRAMVPPGPNHVAPAPAAPRTNLGEVGEFDAMMTMLDTVASQCIKCGREANVFKARVTSKGSGTTTKLVCNPCNAVMTMAGRKLDPNSKCNLKALNAEDSIKFFRNACDTKGLDGRLEWSKVRATLKETMVDRISSSKSVTWSDRYLPLPVWSKKGYDADRIEAAGKCFDDSVLGMVYAAPLCVVQRAATEEHVEQAIRDSQRSGTRADACEDPDFDDFAGKDVVPAVATGKTETPLQQKARLQKEAQKEAQKQATTTAKQSAANVRQNNKNNSLGARCLAFLPDPLAKVIKCVNDSRFAAMPDILKNKIIDIVPKLTDAIKESKLMAKAVVKANKKGELLGDLPFESDDLKGMASDVKTLISHFENMAKMLS